MRPSPFQRDSTAGFSLIETLVASALFTVLLAAVLDIVTPLSGTFHARSESADLTQRLRAAADALSQALRAAGSGSLVGAHRGPLAWYLPGVLPYRVGESRHDPAVGVRFRRDVVSVVFAPITAAQAVLREGAARDATFLSVAWGRQCPPPTETSVCGFTPGMHVLLFDRTGRSDLLTVTAVYGDTLEVARTGGLAFSYGPGAVVSEVVVRSFSVRPDAAGVSQLFQFDGFQSEFPVVEHVVALGVEYFGDPQPPARLTDVLLEGEDGPWTTYGPPPPALAADDATDSWPTGENCLFQVVDGAHVPRLPALGAGRALVALPPALLTDGPFCPDAGSPFAYDADLLRVRLVRLRLRLQVASAMLRGPAGVLFQVGGGATRSEQLVPDQEVVFDVAPPNLAFDR